MKKLSKLLFLLLCLSLTGNVSAVTSEVFNKQSQKNTPDKKEFFLELLYPIVLKANIEVLNEREFIENADIRILENYCKKYRIKNCSRNKLLQKVNILPPSIVLAQAAIESGWGTSRFVLKANNLFGQWCFKKGCGLVPLGRDTGKKHEVRKFDDLLSSVRSYLRNINSHPAYKGLREIREKGFKMNGHRLTEGLLGYSERGSKYVKNVQDVIRQNDLKKFDEAFIQEVLQPEFKDSQFMVLGGEKTFIMDSSGRKIRLSRRASIDGKAGDEVSSLESFVSVVFPEKLRVHLQPDSVLKINRYQESQKLTRIDLYLKNGSADFDVLDEENISLNVRTPREELMVR